MVRLNTYLRRYISPLVTRDLFHEQKLPILLEQQEIKNITALVLDMRGFVRTTRSGEHTDQGLDVVARLLRSFFSRIIRIAFEHHGLVGEFAGDRVLITFGFPSPSMIKRPDVESVDDLRISVQQAVSAAFGIQRMSEAIKRDEELPPTLRQFEVGIGICAGGPAWIGDIGSNNHLENGDSWRQELTIISTAINIAARAEEMTKYDDFIALAPEKRIIVDKVVVDQIFQSTDKQSCVVEDLHEVEVRGLSEKVNLFHFIELNPEALPQPEPIAEEDKGLVDWICEHIDGAIERDTVSKIHRALSDAGQIIVSEKTINEDNVLEQILIQVVESFKAKKVTLYLIDPNTQELVIKSYTGPELPFDRLPPGTGIAGEVAVTGEGVCIADVHTDQRWSGRQADPTVHSMMCVPLKIGNKIVGVIQVMDDRVGAYKQTELSSLNIFAGLAVVALENVRTYRQAIQIAKARTKITEVFSSALTLDEVLEAVMEAVKETLSTRNATLYLVDPETGDLIFEKVISESENPPAQNTRLPKGKGIVGRVVTTKKSILIANTHTDPDWYDQIGSDIYSMICVPLIAKGQTVGAIQVLDRKPAFFDNEHLLTLEWLAASAAVAVDNAFELEQARRRLIASDTIAGMGAIAGKLAHNLKNYVSGIKFIAKHQLKPDDEKTKQRVEKIITAADQALDEVRNFMQPLEQGVEAADIDLDATLLELIDEIKENFKERKKSSEPKPEIIIQHQRYERSLLIYAVKDQIKYIFRNLIDNASRAIDEKGEPKGKISLKTSVEQVNELERAVVTVTDTGVGILPENIERIFMRSFTTRPEGTVGGYGLFWVRLNVERIGGRITAESIPGSGATFIVRLPCVSKPERKRDGDET